ncbi:MAG: glutaredoxin family protein [Gammaproteobacteria bacterium]|nr:glutaredoxin family protein [Gammaproteobacteria bacterium]
MDGPCLVPPVSAPDPRQTRARGPVVTGGPARVVLYVRDGCPLCDDFLLGLSLELGPAVGRIEVVNVDGDPGLAVRYGLRVPVLEVGGEVACEGRYDPAQVRSALRV